MNEEVLKGSCLTLFFDFKTKNEPKTMEIAKKCRSCLSNLVEWNAFSIDDIGCGTYTYKEMFETAPGYPILPTEPQHFCDLCAQRLIEWHDFQNMCQGTQESLYPIKIEPEECHSETVWCADPPKQLQIKLEPENSEEVEEKTLMNRELSKTGWVEWTTEPFEVQCKVFMRNFGAMYFNKSTPIGTLRMTGKSTAEFMHETWLFVALHLKREIVFDDKGKNPRWHPDEHPQEKDLIRFISFKDLKAKKTFDIPPFSRLRSWKNYQPSLFVFPYSKNVKNSEQWEAAEKTLIRMDEAYPSALDEPPEVEQPKIFPQSTKIYHKKPHCTSKNQSSFMKRKLSKEERHTDPFEIQCNVLLRPCASFNLKQCTPIGILRMTGRSTSEFMHQTWLYVMPHLKREIVFDDKGENPRWHPNEHPQERDLIRFADFRDSRARQSYKIPPFSRIKKWRNYQPSLFVYPYSKNIKKPEQWQAAQEAFTSMKEYESCFDPFHVLPEEEDSKNFHQSTENYPEKPQFKHGPFSECTSEIWERKKERHTDPFEVQCNVFLRPCASLTEKKCTPIGILRMTGKSTEEFMHQTWLYVVPHLKREIVFDDDGENPRWYPNEHPQENDLNRFVDFRDSRARASYKTPPLIRFKCWKDYQPSLFIYPYSKNIKKSEQWEAAEEKLINSTRPVDDPPEDGYSNTLSQLTREKSQYKQCPFPECTSMVQAVNFKPHCHNCRFNPNRVLTLACPHKGCSRLYAVQKDYKRHVRLCKKNPQRISTTKQQCPYCPAMVVSVPSHIYFSHSKNTFVCDICGSTRTSKGLLKSHMISHTTVKLICDKCPFEFKSKKTLQYHIKRQHTEKPLEMNFKCDQCSYQTYNHSSFGRHMKVRHDPTSIKFTCHECPKQFGTKTALKGHMETHAESLEFTCEVCSHVSKTKRGLKCHMTLHEEWQYKCPVCQMKRRSAYEVRMHCMRKHPDYKQPPKFTVMNTKSKLHGQLMQFSQDEERK